MKKIVSVFLATALAASACATLAGCDGDNKNYPVSVADITIETEPKDIVVLSDETADIISYLGYATKMVGRSDEVTQNFLSVAPSVGSAKTPDVEKIKSYAADIVFADDTLDENCKEQLTDAGIMVLTIASPETTTELETVYLTLGKVLGGTVDGARTGQDSYKKLIDAMKTCKAETNSNVTKTICYLYLNGDKLNTLHSGTYGDMLLGYTGAVNAAVNVSESEIDTKILKVANPDYILYADEETLQFIQNDSDLKGLKALKNNQTLLVTKEEMSRMGTTSLLTLNKIMNFMYPDRVKKSSEDTSESVVPSAVEGATTATKAESSAQTTTGAAVSNGSVEGQYNIKVSGLTLKLDDENNNVKAMQQRLFDLGYITDKENVTGYYGEVTQKAVKEFQKASGLTQSGTADTKTLTALFKSDAKAKA